MERNTEHLARRISQTVLNARGPILLTSLVVPLETRLDLT